MIETNEAAPEAETDANFSAERITTRVNAKDKPGLRFTFGTPARTITTTDLSLGDQLTLVEIAGESATNRQWMTLAGFAASIHDIDGRPMPAVSSKRDIAKLLDEVTEDGLIAFFKAMKKTAPPVVQSEAETVATAKNF